VLNGKAIPSNSKGTGSTFTNLGLDNKYVLLHLGEALEMHVFPLLQTLMGIATILPMVLSYFELDGYRDLRGGSPACARQQVSHLLKAQTIKILYTEKA